MESAVTYTLASIALVSVVALVGVLSLGVSRRRLDAVLTVLVSFAAGTLFGGVFLHILPETVAEYGFDATTGLYVLAGILLAFVVEKYLFWHQHRPPPAGDGHAHPVGSRPTDASPGATPLPYMILFGDVVHNAIDGVVIAASYLTSVPLGVATTVAVTFHEIPQEVGDFGALVYGGFSRRKAVAYNFLTALTAFLGAGVVLALGDVGGLLAVVLPLAAGNFIYIAGSDLLPELAREHRPLTSTAQVGTFALGVTVLYLLTYVE